MSSRDAILQAVRAARPAEILLPDVQAAVRDFPPPSGDLVARFVAAARASGARVLHSGPAAVASIVAEAYPEARRIVSIAPGVPGTVSLPDSAHDLADTDLFVCEAVIGIAENGGVWLPVSRLGNRAALFLATHVAVLLDPASIVADFHAAYAAVDAAAEPFGMFMAGPSKTADIEQSLVVGAHGPTSLTLVLTSGTAPSSVDASSSGASLPRSAPGSGGTAWSS